MNEILGIALLGLGVFGTVLFAVLYSFEAPWWHSEVGWHLVTFTSALGLLMANGLVFRVLGDYPGRQVVNLLLFAVVVASVYWRIALLVRANRKGRRGR